VASLQLFMCQVSVLKSGFLSKSRLWLKLEQLQILVASMESWNDAVLGFHAGNPNPKICASVLWLRCVQLLAKEHVYKLLVPGGKAPKRKPETTNEDLKPPEGKLEPKPKGKANAKAGTSKKTKLAKE